MLVRLVENAYRGILYSYGYQHDEYHTGLGVLRQMMRAAHLERSERPGKTVILSEANDYRDVGGRATQEAKADDYRDVGGRATPGAVAEPSTGMCEKGAVCGSIVRRSCASMRPQHTLRPCK